MGAVIAPGRCGRRGADTCSSIGGTGVLLARRVEATRGGVPARLLGLGREPGRNGGVPIMPVLSLGDPE